MSFNMDGYVPVHERIARFYEKHPDGRIVADPPDVVELDGALFIASTVRAYANPTDTCPWQGSAWEPFPGQTSFTRNSEAMNAETSAIGRALAAAGIEVRTSLASRDEVQARNEPPHPLSERVGTVMADIARLTDTHKADLKTWADGRKLSGRSMLNDEAWLELVETWLDEHPPTTTDEIPTEKGR